MEEIKLLNNAYKIYNLDNREDIQKKILDYISNRLIANRSNFNQMIGILKLDITFDDILQAFNSAYREEENYKKADNYTQGEDYFSGIYPVPHGNIIVETNDVLEVVKYFVRGIKSRNTIVISQTEYDELSISNMILIIFVEALAKFNISRNTLMIMPFEECYYDEFDEVIVIEDGKFEVKLKEFSKVCIIYKETSAFNDEIANEETRLKEKNISYKIISGNLEEALDIINKERPESTAIYTQNPDIAYKFVNLAKSQNVFVNSSLLNSEQLNDGKNKLYYKRKIMYPSNRNYGYDEYMKNYFEDGKIQKENLQADKEISNEVTKIQKSKIESNENKISQEYNSTNSNESLVEFVNPWYKKIFEKIKKFLFGSKG